jgi:hypothetical protein
MRVTTIELISCHQANVILKATITDWKKLESIHAISEQFNKLE